MAGLEPQLPPDPDGRFKGVPIRTDYIDGRMWRLARNVTYRTASCGLLTIRRGFIFDWASVPRAFWRIAPPAGDKRNPYGYAALIHDWLYVHQRIDGEGISRAVADWIFREVLQYVGCTRWRCWLMWKAVRAFGWVPWNRNAKQEQKP